MCNSSKYYFFVCLFLISLAGFGQGNAPYVRAAEYYWDTDPGQGSGFTLNASDGTFDGAFEAIMHNSLTLPATTGPHTLYMRVQDSIGTWGVSFGAVVNIMDSLVTTRDIKVTAGEYYWDTDPGEGSGTAFVAFDGNFDAAFEQIINSNVSIPGTTGPHTLYSRVQDAEGVWGPTFGVVIDIFPSTLSARNIEVTAGEYYWDSDPGEGSGTAYLAFDGNFDAAFEQIINSNVSIPGTTGPHTLYSRVQDAEGVWGPTFGVVIDIFPSTLSARNIEVTAGEYYWDSDPGEGSGTAYLAFDGNFDAAFEQIINSNVSIPGTTGPHTLYSRVQDAEGVWGPAFGVVIDIFPSTLSARNIEVTAGEYFWDTDPGEGSGTAYLAFDGNFDAAFEQIINSNVSIPGTTGPHTLYSRVKDAEGIWGPVFGVVVDIFPSTATARNTYVKAAEYFFDTDPGQGNATAIFAQDGSFDAVFEVLEGGSIPTPIDTGIHALYIRAMDAEDVWGPVFGVVVYMDSSISGITASFTGDSVFCENDTGTTYMYNATAHSGSSYSWSVTGGTILSGQDSTTVSVKWNGLAPYLIKLVETNAGIPDSVEMNVMKLDTTVMWVEVSICQGQSYFAQGANQTTTGLYLDVYTGGNGCDSTVYTNLTVNPAYFVSTDTAICSGDSIFLAGAFRNSSGSYYDSLTTGLGCDSVFEYNLTVYSPVQVVAPVDQNICSGSSITLTATGVSGYSWNNGISNGLAFIPDSSDTYIVTGTDSNGCVSNDSSIITVQEKPVISVSASDSCSDETGILVYVDTLKNASAVVWSDIASVSGSFLNPVADTTIYLPDASVKPGFVVCYACVTDSVACPSVCDSVGLTVDNLPNVNAGNDTAICFGNSIILSSSGTAESYTWDNGVIDGVPFTPSTTKTYILEGTNSNGCGRIDSVIVMVNSNPVADAGNDDTLCPNLSTTIGGVPSGSGGTGSLIYSWSPGATLDDSTLANPLASPTTAPPINTYSYFLSVTDSLGCSGSDTITLTIIDLLANAGGGANDTILACRNDSVTLGETPSVSGGKPPYSFNWYELDPVYGDVSDLSDPNISNPTMFSMFDTIAFVLKVTDAQSCIDTDFVYVVKIDYPSFTLEDVSYCPGETDTLGQGVTLDPNYTYSYQWIPTAFLSNSNILNPVTSTPVDTGYRLTVINIDVGCTSNDTLRVDVKNASSVDAGLNTEICLGDTLTLSATGASSYTWDNGLGSGATHDVSPNTTTTYNVVGSDTSACSGSDQVTVTVNALPVQPIITENSGVLTSTSATSYQWLLEGAEISGATSQSYTPTQNGNYTVRIIDANGCENTSEIYVFTADGIWDQLASEFTISPNPNFGTFNLNLELRQLEEVEISLLNILGEEVKLIRKDYTNALSEKVDMSDQPAGIYFLRVRVHNYQLIRKIVKE